MTIEATVLIDLTLGDSGKGKIAYNESKTKNYDFCLKFNGGSNSGRTIYIEDKKYISHLFPTGIVSGIKSIIGCGCVLNEKKFFNELEELTKFVPNAHNLIKVAYNAHIVTDDHIKEENNESLIGTTKQGIGPAFRDKHARIGIRAEKITSLKPFLVDPVNDIFIPSIEKNKIVNIFCEGVQSIGLDINHGDYPYVTSSSCGVGEAINNGIPPNSIKRILGCVKSYVTYVGTKEFQDKNDPILDKIGDLGFEFGSTTGRRRAVNYLDLDMVKKHMLMNSVNELHVNKMDILKELNCWKLFKKGILYDLKTEENFKEEIINYLGHELIYNWYYGAK